MLTLGCKIGVTVLFMEIEILLEGLIVGLTPKVVFVVKCGNPLIRRALIVKGSVYGLWLSCLSLKKQFWLSRVFGK